MGHLRLTPGRLCKRRRGGSRLVGLIGGVGRIGLVSLLSSGLVGRSRHSCGVLWSGSDGEGVTVVEAACPLSPLFPLLYAGDIFKGLSA